MNGYIEDKMPFIGAVKLFSSSSEQQWGRKLNSRKYLTPEQKNVHVFD